jgi:hypothetical protein
MRALHSLRLIPSIEKDPKLLVFFEGLLGKVVLVCLFTLLLNALANPLWLQLSLAVTACAYSGSYRRKVFPILTVLMLVCCPPWFTSHLPELAARKEGLYDRVNFPLLYYSTLLIFFIFSATILFCTRRFGNILPFRRPFLSLLLFFAALVILVASKVLHGFSEVFLWSFIDILAVYFWYLSLVLSSQRNNSPGSLWFKLGFLHPFFGGDYIPVGRGPPNFIKLEATTSRALAISQIKAVKLLMWCFLLRIVHQCILVSHGYLSIPTFDEAFRGQVNHLPYPWYSCWGALIFAFFETVLEALLFYNTFVAFARMAGFPLPRGAYKPFAARTIAEFWNRYIFYFKELMAELFFYPTFIQCFRNNTNLRIAFATFMAAGVGNMLFHFVLTMAFVCDLGLMKAVVGFQTYCFYCLLLTGGIIYSQLSPRKTSKPRGWLRDTMLPSLKVMLFYCLLHIFDDINRQYSLSQHIDFLLHLFGLK